MVSVDLCVRVGYFKESPGGCEVCTEYVRKYVQSVLLGSFPEVNVKPATSDPTNVLQCMITPSFQPSCGSLFL